MRYPLALVTHRGYSVTVAEILSFRSHTYSTQNVDIHETNWFVIAGLALLFLLFLSSVLRSCTS